MLNLYQTIRVQTAIASPADQPASSTSVGPNSRNTPCQAGIVSAKTPVRGTSSPSVIGLLDYLAGHQLVIISQSLAI